MLQRVKLAGIDLPRLYIAEDADDVKLARDKGIPYVRWNQGQEELIKILLRPVLEQKFPHIDWVKVLGPKRRFRTKVIAFDKVDKGTDQVADVGSIAESVEGTFTPEFGKEREGSAIKSHIVDGEMVETSIASMTERLFCNSAPRDMFVERKLRIADYVGDMNSYVDIDVLQRLRLMPAFLGDILDCIKLNLGSGMRWTEGYNKRLGLPVGRFNASGQLPNLIILDVSGSIPRGISATMISLIDTLRSQLSADLIITGSNSRFYPMGSALPDPQRIRDMFGYGNESYDFLAILNSHVRGRHFGHVFSFGDCDTPYYRFMKDNPNMSLQGTKVECVHHYHTGIYHSGDTGNDRTGYAKWCHMLADAPIEEHDTNWCKVIKE